MDRLIFPLIALITAFSSPNLPSVPDETSLTLQAVHITPALPPPYCPDPTACPTKNQGDGDCNGSTVSWDYTLWTRQFMTFPGAQNTGTNANYACQEGHFPSSLVDIIDFEVWRRNASDGLFIPTPTLTGFVPSVTPTGAQSPSSTPPSTPSSTPTRTPTPSPTRTPTPTITPTPTSTPAAFSCPTTSTQTYGSGSVSNPSLSPIDDQRIDIRLSLRTLIPVPNAVKDLINLSGDTDVSRPPQLSTLLSPSGIKPVFSNVYRAQGELDSEEVNVLGIQTAPGANIYVPVSDYLPAGNYQAYVLYARNQDITLKYTSSDGIVSGYTVHITGVCVDPNLQTLYNQLRNSRNPLPLAARSQLIGKANGQEIQVAIRDTGSMMDPRSRKDWWQGF